MRGTSKAAVDSGLRRARGAVASILLAAALIVGSAGLAEAADPPTFESITGNADSQWFESLSSEHQQAVVAAVAAGCLSGRVRPRVVSLPAVPAAADRR